MRHGRWLTILAAGAIVTALAGITTSLAWAQHLEKEQRLVPGTTIAGIEVGELPADEAAERIRERLDRRFEADVTLHATGERWPVSAADLDVETDVDGAVREALARTEDAGFVELAQLHLLEEDVDLAVEVTTGIDAAQQRIRSAVLELDIEVDLPVRAVSPQVATDHLAPVVGPLNEVAANALDREITVSVNDVERTLTPRELDAQPDVDALLARTLSADHGAAAVPDTPDEVPLDVPDDTLDAVVSDLADAVERPVRDAEFDWSSGELGFIAERTGRGLDTATAHTQLVDAIRGGADRVELASSYASGPSRSAGPATRPRPGCSPWVPSASTRPGPTRHRTGGVPTCRRSSDPARTTRWVSGRSTGTATGATP